MKQRFTTYNINIRDEIEGVSKIITRCVREGQGWKHFGTFSYKGEKLQLVMGMGSDGSFTSENYPPPVNSCKTKAAKEYYSKIFKK